MLRTRSVEEKAGASRAFEREVLPKLASGDLTPIVDRTYPLEKAAEAYAYVEQNKNFGKVVLTMPGTSEASVSVSAPART